MKNVVYIDPNKCNGPLFCDGMPFVSNYNCMQFCAQNGSGAINCDTDQGFFAQVDYALCGGCGDCIPCCPKQAIQKAVLKDGVVKFM